MDELDGIDKINEYDVMRNLLNSLQSDLLSTDVNAPYAQALATVVAAKALVDIAEVLTSGTVVINDGK